MIQDFFYFDTNFIYIFEEHENAVEQAELAGKPKPMDRVFVQLEPEEFPKDSFPVRTFETWPKKN